MGNVYVELNYGLFLYRESIMDFLNFFKVLLNVNYRREFKKIVLGIRLWLFFRNIIED